VKRSRSSSNVARWSFRRRLRSPPKTSGSPAAHSVASWAACRASALPWPVLGTDRCMQATTSWRPSASSSRVIARRRRSGRVASVSARVATIRAGGRTSRMFEPPSFEPIRSGFHTANRARSNASELREVRSRTPSAPVACSRPASQRGGASCSSATSHAQAARRAANSACSGLLTWTCVASRSARRVSFERQVSSSRFGGKSRPWKRFQVRSRNTMPG